MTEAKLAVKFYRLQIPLKVVARVDARVDVRTLTNGWMETCMPKSPMMQVLQKGKNLLSRRALFPLLGRQQELFRVASHGSVSIPLKFKHTDMGT